MYGVVMSDEATIRRRPRQARSQQRVDHLLDIAAVIFRDVGFEAATTNMIAAQAGLPIGSLYQFFPNKQAIMDALVERYVTEMRTLFDRTFSPEVTAGMSFAEVMDGFLSAMAAFDASHHAFRPIFLSSGLPISNEMHYETLHRVETLITSRFPTLPADRSQTASIVGVAIVKGLMRLTEPPDSLPPQQVLHEIKTTIMAYLRHMLVEAGISLPPELK